MDASLYPRLYTPRNRLGTAAAMLAVAWAVHSLPVVADFERTLYDLRVRLVSERDEPTAGIVVVEVDDHSLEEFREDLKRWPWPRFLQGYLIEYLSAARVVGVDILYPEEQGELWSGDPGDGALVQAVGEAGNVVLAAFFSDEISDMASPRGLARMRISTDGDSAARLPPNYLVLSPFPELLEAGAAIGDVSVRRDPDGKVRQYPAVQRFGEDVYPSLALAVAARARGVGMADIRLADGRVRFGEASMALAEDGSFLYVPHHAAYERISAADIIYAHNAERAGIEPEYPRGYFRDRIVLLGITATGVRDEEITPLRTPGYGVWIHADAIDNLLRGVRFRVASGRVLGWLMVLLGLAPAAVRVERPWHLLLLAAGLLLAFLVPAVGLALTRRLMLPMTGPLLAVGFSCTGLGMLSWAQERARRRHLEALDRAKQQYTDMLVHDLKNAVAPVVMALTMMADDKRRGGAETAAKRATLQREFPEIVSASASKLMAQINALLDIRRMEEGRMQLCLEDTSPGEILRRVEADYQAAVRRTGLDFQVEPGGGEDRRVRVDGPVLDRILGNMIWNAVKYAAPQSRIRVGCRDDGEAGVWLSVVNRGKPIPREAQAGLFATFVTGASPAARDIRVPSTGLGLAFCRLAAEAHGGRIELQSPAPGQADGVEVRVLLPAPP